MPQYLFRIQPIRSVALSKGFTESESRTISEHFAYLQKLTGEGTVLLAGRTTNTDNSSFGIVIFNATSEEDARQIMNNDPAVKDHVFRAELFPYRNSLLNDKGANWEAGWSE